MKKIVKSTILAGLVFLPTIVFAQGTFGNISLMLDSIGRIIDRLIIFLVGIALLVFFWGLVKFILKLGGDVKAAEDGKKLMIWGIVALFVMVSVWGLVRFLRSAFLGEGTPITAPNIVEIVPKRQ